jgi:hypothetical protein
MSLCPSVGPSACINSSLTGRIFMKLDILALYKLDKIEVVVNYDKDDECIAL